MSVLALRDVPENLHAWLKRQAASHHRSVNKEIIVLLENAWQRQPSPSEKPTAEEILAMGRECAALPVVDDRSADEKPAVVLTNPLYPIGQTGLPSLLATGRVQWNGKRPRIDPHRPVATLRGGSTNKRHDPLAASV